MLELVGGGSVINGPTPSSFKTKFTVKNFHFFSMNEGLSNHPYVMQVYTLVVNKLASYAFANKPTVHSG